MRKRILTLEERDEEWLKLPQNKRTFKNILYDDPVRIINDRVFFLVDIIPVSDFKSLEFLLEDLKDKYEHKKETDRNMFYRLLKRRYRIEVWRTY